MTFDISTLWIEPESLSWLSWISFALAIIIAVIFCVTGFICIEDGELGRTERRILAITGLATLGLGAFFIVGLNGAAEDRAEARASLGTAIQERYGIELADNVLDKLTQGRGQNRMAEGGEAMMREMAGTADIVLDGEDVTVGLAWAGDQWRLVEGSDVRSAEYPLADAVEEDQS